MKIRNECSGCFNGSTCYSSCPIAHCSFRNEDIEYCFQCNKYPCDKYDGIDSHDSLISHRNQKKDLIKAKNSGIESYLAEQQKKGKILNYLLSRYDDGKKEVFFCLAVNMMDVEDINSVIKRLDVETAGMSLSEKAETMKDNLRKCAEDRNIPLKLRKW